MSVDGGVTTSNVFLAAVYCYSYGFEVLLRIRKGENLEFLCDVPSLDATALETELESGTLSISDLQAYITNYSRITGILRKLDRERSQSWSSDEYIAGRRKDGTKIA
jgi:hypothetical protein